MTIKERILSFLKEQGISREEFYRDTELSASNFKGAALKSELGGDKIVKILTSFKVLSPEWLLMGEGPMLRTDSVQQPTEPSSVSASSDAVVLRLMDKLDEKDTLLKDKESKIEHLQSELLAAREELATFKAKYPEPTTAHPKGLGPLETAPHAPSHPHSPSSEHYHGGSCPPQQE